MASRITHRTLLGFRTLFQKNGTEQINIKTEKLVDRAITDKDNLIKDLQSLGYWRNNRRIKEYMKFSAVVGNPPYQEKKEDTSDSPVYHYFMDIAFSVAPRVSLITPARFLFNAGKTPKEWNKKILSDEHLKVVWYKQKSSEIFPNVDIKGGVAVTYRDAHQKFGSIGIYSSFPELNSIRKKISVNAHFQSLSEIIFPQNKFILEQLYKDFPEYKNIIGSNGNEKRLTTSIFNLLDIFKEGTSRPNAYYRILGLINNVRTWRILPAKYIESNEFIEKYKVFVPKSNGTGVLGEVLSTPLIGEPFEGVTQYHR